MAYVLSETDMQRLQACVGQVVSTSGSCAHQDESGVASNGDTASYTGILRTINIDPATQEFKSLTLEVPPGSGKLKEAHMGVTPGDYVWDIGRTITCNDVTILSFTD